MTSCSWNVEDIVVCRSCRTRPFLQVSRSNGLQVSLSPSRWEFIEGEKPVQPGTFEFLSPGEWAWPHQQL